MKRLGGLCLGFVASVGQAWGQAPAPPEQAARTLIVSLAQVQALVAGWPDLVNRAAYWEDACKSTPECGGPEAKMGDRTK